jgi:glycosyltransferase involved in cell wall biosynthesis/SAM-dependent methyltransferase
MNVTVLTWRDLANASAGGAEVMFDRILKELAMRDNDVTLVCGGPIAQRDYRVVAAGGTYSQYVLIPLLCATRFRNTDVVIDTENGFPYFSPLWRRGPSVCAVHHIHSDQWTTRFPRPVAAVCRMIELRVMPKVYRKTTFIAISQSTASALEAIGIDRERIRVIEPGIDLADGPPPAKSPVPVYVSLNRLVPYKRIDLLLRAWELASEEIPGRLVVAGDGPELTTLRAVASGISRTEFVGRIAEAEKTRLLGESWMLVIASHHEGWGLAVLEAATLGTPTLAIDVPGIRDSVEDGITGTLVKAPDDELVAAFAKAWVELASDPEALKRMGVAACERSAIFNWDSVVDKWVQVLEEVNKGRRVRSTSDAVPLTTSLRRSVVLFQKFRTQYDDPDGFYTYLAEDTVELVEQYEPVEGQRVVDIGGGRGYFTKAFLKSGAASCFVEPFWDEMGEDGRSTRLGIIGDGVNLPFADCTFDISHSSNVIEHVSPPKSFFDELVRVVRPGGLIFLAFTNWLSPFGGHETSPWHYFGGEWAAQRYERRMGYAPKNRYGAGLYRLDISQVLSWARHEARTEFIDTFPRYYPRWTKGIVHIPGVREFATWNLVVVLRRR